MSATLPLSLWLSGTGAGSNPSAWVRPGAYLDIDFVKNRGFTRTEGTVLPSTLLTTTRTSPKLLPNAAGTLLPFLANTLPRTDLGCTPEEARTNLFLWSDVQSNAAWFSGGVNPTVVSTNNIAPDGTATATRLTIGSGSAAAIRQAVTVTNNQPVVISVYVKLAPSNAASKFRICTNNGGAWNTGGDAIIVLTNSWQQVTLTFQNSFGISVAAYFGAQKSDISEDNFCKGDVLIWGADFNANNSIPLSHITTTTTTVTRAADSIVSTTAFSNVAPTTTGTYLFEMGAVPWGNDSHDHTLLAFTAASGTPGIARFSGGNIQLNDGVGYRTTQAYTNGAAFKYAVAFGGTSINSSLNGGTVSNYASYTGSIASTGLPFRLGAGSGSAYWNASFKRITVYPTQLSNAQIQALST